MEEMTQPADQAPPSIGATGIARGEPEVAPERAAQVKKWLGDIKKAEKKYEPRFKQMRENMRIARTGAVDKWDSKTFYTVPIIGRHINQAVASLYAKNPRVAVKRKERLLSTVWDGTVQSLQMAMQALAMNPMDMASAQVLADAQQAKMHQQMLDKVCKTAELVLGYYWNEPALSFKEQLRAAIRRAKVCGVAYIELNFQRQMEPAHERTGDFSPHQQQIQHFEANLGDYVDGKLNDNDPRVDELATQLSKMQNDPEVIVREGPLYDFPSATNVIPDPKFRSLKGFVGCDWLATKRLMSPAKVKEIYKVDISEQFSAYKPDGTDVTDRSYVEGEESKERGMACVYEVQDKATGTYFTVCDGYKDYLKEPTAPVPAIERFWKTYTLVFNEAEVEDGEDRFPPGDPELLRHAQRDYNTSRQGLREHRRANRPKYFSRRGTLEQQDKDNLAEAEANAIIEVNSADGPPSSVLEAWKPVPIDPGVYDTTPYMEDVLRGVGSQEANVGGTSGDTATESSIAEGSRLLAIQAQVEELDEMMTELARGTLQALMLELDPMTVQEVAGPGAVWPELTKDQIYKEIDVEVKAGSSGRPNRAAELASMERALPFLIQIPGINPMALARKYSELLDISVDELVIEGMPSIQAINSMAGKAMAGAQATGDPRSDPNQQGGEGQDNAPDPQQNEPGAQPAYPQPGDENVR
jgi:hypothetical protein